MKVFKLLIVDDDDQQVQSLLDVLKEKEKELSQDGIKIVSEICKNKDDALTKISTKNYDYAIVDLKLSVDNTKTEGNEVLKEIKNKMRFPVTVLSNFPQSLDTELAHESDVFFIHERTATKYSELIDRIIKLYKTGITELFADDGFLLTHINNSLHDLFWVRIANDWNYITGTVIDPISRSKVVAKQLTNLFKEEMQLNDFGLGVSQPFEMYLIPPVRKYYYTGDIISKDGKHFLIITPACDMEIRNGDKPKVETVVISHLWHVKDHFITKECWSNDRFQDSKKEKILNILKFKQSGYHLLPPFKDKMGFIIDFADISSISYEDLKNYKRVASITEPYLKNILSRFSNHFNRLGQPDFNEESLLKEIKDL